MKCESNFTQQTGQALPLGIALFFVLGVTSFIFFNTGQTVTNKTRIVNATDSAAYSGLLWQARAMNFIAYTNRAMVANQVAMAQAVSLNSWSAYLNSSAGNMNSLSNKVPYIGTVTGMISTFATSLDALITPVSEGILEVVDSVNAGLSSAQEAMYLATFSATPDVVSSVVQSNDVMNQGFEWTSKYSLLHAGLNLNNWESFTEKFELEHTEAMQERKKLVERSLDRFSLQRRWEYLGLFFPITPLNWVRLEKHGTTKLYKNGDDWEWYATDALSLREKKYIPKGQVYSDFPVGGGSAIANTSSRWESIAGEPEFFPDRHSVAKKRLKSSDGTSNTIHNARKMMGYSGIHAYRSLSEKRRHGEEPPILKLKVEVKNNPDNIVSADELGGKSVFRNNIDTPGDVISSVSSAELYFERPCLNNTCDQSITYANGYSPYWDVRLANTSNSARLAAYTMHADTLTDKQHYIPTKLHKLKKYDGKLATPLDDYKQQVRGVESMLSNMERRLLTLEQGSNAYRKYEERLGNIRNNINLEIGSIALDIVQKPLIKDNLILSLALAADVDFDVREFEILKDVTSDLYSELSSSQKINTPNIELTDRVAKTTKELKDQIVHDLENKLKNAVTTLLKRLAIRKLESLTGIQPDKSDFESIVSKEVQDILTTQFNKQHASDLNLDFGDECSIYLAVTKMEMKVRELQTKMEQVNQVVAKEFHAELVRISAESTATRQLLEKERDDIGSIINSAIRITEPNIAGGNSSLEGRRAMLKYELLDSRINGLSEARVDLLVEALKNIIYQHTRLVPAYREFILPDRFVRQSVLDMIGDIDNWEVNENHASLSVPIYGTESNRELQSDRIQELMQRPEHC